MKEFSPVSLPKLLTTLGLVVFAVSNSYGLTVITNDGFTENNQSIPDTIVPPPDQVSIYGSNASVLNTSPNWSLTAGIDGVVGTPDIALTWDMGKFETYTNWDGRGNVVQLDSLSTSSVFNITFVPSATVAVNVGSFDLDAWSGTPGGTDIIVNWSLTNLDGSQTYSSGVFTKPGVSGGRSTITTNYTGLIGQSLVLRMDQIQGDGSYLAFDNLSFDQIAAVPEPAQTALIIAGGLIALITGRRGLGKAR